METEDIIVECEPSEVEPETAEPIVRTRNEHTISRRNIDPDAIKVLYRLVRSRYTAYLVGGGVRDLLLGRRPKDFDVVTNARPEEIRNLFRNSLLIGRRFRLAHIRYGEKIIETSTFRSTPVRTGDPDDPETDLLQRDDNLFGTPREDALRRDFTVNGLFYDISTFSIIDWVGGLEDLAARRIRSIGDPNIRFREDPVRMIRAVRFASRLGFEIEPQTLAAIEAHTGEMTKASPARLLEEITRLFAFSSGRAAMRLLVQTGLLRVILPELADALDSDEADQDGFWAALQALDVGDTVLPDATPSLLFAVLLLEPLKRALARQWRIDNFPRLKFEKIYEFLEPIAQRLRFPRRMTDRIIHLYMAQSRFVNNPVKAGAITNFVTQESFHEALALAEIYSAAAGQSHQKLDHWRDLLAERMYGDDGRKNTQPQQQGQGGSPAGNGSGQPMSRSARRRRNRRNRRLLEAQVQQGAPEPQEAAAEPIAVQEAPDPVPAEPVEAAVQQAGNGRRSSRSRGRHRRARQQDATEAAQPEAPLTASAFYSLPEPEPEPEPEEQPKSKRGGRRSKKETKKEERTEESARLYVEPGVNRSDVANTPYDWMDEL